MNDAGVDAIKAIGKDTGAGGKFSIFVAGNAEQINDQFTETNLARYRAVIFLGTGANALLNDAQKAAFESYFHNGGGFLGIGSAIETEPDWQFYTDILGTRASGKTDVQSATVKVADRVHDASKNLPQYWNRTDAWYNFAANVRGVSHVLATVVEDPFGPQPQGQVLDGIAGGTMGADHPVVWCKDYKGGRSFYTAGGNTAGSFGETAFRSHLEGAIDWTAGVADRVYSDCGATVLRELPADQDQRAAEPERADRLRPAPRRPRHPDRPPRRHPPARPDDGDDDDPRDHPGLHRATRTASTAPRSTTTSPPTSGSTSTTRRRRSRTSSCRTARSSRRRRRSTQRPTRAPASPSGTRGSATSSCRGSSSSTPPPARRRTSTCRPSSRSCGSRTTAAPAATSPATSTSTSTTTSGSPTGDDSPAGGGNSGGFSPFNDHEDGRGPDGARHQRHGRHVHADLQRPDDEPARVQLDGRADRRPRCRRLSTRRPRQRHGHRWARQHGERDRHVPRRALRGRPAADDRRRERPDRRTTPTAARSTRRPRADSGSQPHVDSRRSSLNTNDLRGKLLRIKVKDGDIAPADANNADFGAGGAYTIPAGNLFPLVAGGPQAKTRAEIYAMGFRNPFRVQVDENDVAYISDYSPDSQTPQQFRGPAGDGPVPDRPSSGELRLAALLQDRPAVLPVELQHSQPARLAADADATARATTSRTTRTGTSRAARASSPACPRLPPITEPDIWYSYRDNNATAPLGTPCFGNYGPNALTDPPAPGSTTPCPRLFPELFTGGVGPHGIAKYKYDPANPNTRSSRPTTTTRSSWASSRRTRCGR